MIKSKNEEVEEKDRNDKGKKCKEPNSIICRKREREREVGECI